MLFFLLKKIGLCTQLYRWYDPPKQVKGQHGSGRRESLGHLCVGTGLRKQPFPETQVAPGQSGAPSVHSGGWGVGGGSKKGTAQHGARLKGGGACWDRARKAFPTTDL